MPSLTSFQRLSPSTPNLILTFSPALIDEINSTYSTGALLSTTSSQQGETIPGIAHAVVIESEEGQIRKKTVNRKRRIE